MARHWLGTGCIVVVISLSSAATANQRSDSPSAPTTASPPRVAPLATDDPWAGQQQLHIDAADPWSTTARPLPSIRRDRAKLDRNDPWASSEPRPKAAPAPEPAAHRALREAIKAAVDAGDLDRAAELLRELKNKSQR